VLGIAALLPFTVGVWLTLRKNYALATMGTVFVVHFLCVAAGGRWGSDVDVSRELLSYARAHPDENFLTDVATMNHMYTLGGFTLPANVVCLNGTAVERHFLLNKEPADTPRFHFGTRKIDGILLNLDELDLGIESEFTDYLNQHNGQHMRVMAKHVKFLFRPLVAFTGERPFMISTQGGELVATP
jgi:hypothetical protein